MARRLLGLLLLIAALALAGLSCAAMKATPFFRGEHPKAEGPPEDRVNFWPLAYYRKSALSVLWPLMEFTDEHVALRPVFSAYKLEKPKHEYNVLPPLAQFDFEAKKHRVFPLFWGRDKRGNPYFVAFPAVWTGRDAKGKPYFVGFPLVLWSDRVKGITPVFWSPQEKSFAVAPLFWYKKDSHCHLLPLWAHVQYGKGEYDTHILWPIGRRLKTPDKDGFDVWPLFGAYRGKERGVEWRRAYALGPMFVQKREGDAFRRHILPVYFENRDKESRGWGVLPLIWHEEKGADSFTATPLWWHGKEAKARWDLVLPLFYREKAGDDSLFLSPVWSSGREGDAHWELAPPVYYHREKGKDSLTLTPVWSGGKSGDVAWSAAPPLYYEQRDAAKKTSLVLTPLAGWERSPERKEVAVFPLLSSLAWSKGEKNLWVLAPLAHARWGGDTVEHHVLPFYYYDGREKLFLSLPYSHGGEGGGSFTNLFGLLAHYTREPGGQKTLVLPFALSGVSWRKGGGTVVLPAGLAGASWNETSTRHTILPLYAYESSPERKRFLSPLVSWGKTDTERFVNVFGLGAHYESDTAGPHYLGLLLPFAHFSWGGSETRSTVLPFFSSSSCRPFGKSDPRREDRLWVAPWLISERTVETDRPKGPGAAAQVTRETRCSSLFPLWSYRDVDKVKEKSRETDFALLGPLYDYQFRGGMKSKEDPTKVEDYTRSRLLWRVAHYERTNGHSTLDVFPFITVDRKDDGFRHVSFLWRFYRSERTAEGGRRLDVLFIPLLRRSGAAPPKGGPQPVAGKQP